MYNYTIKSNIPFSIKIFSGISSVDRKRPIKAYKALSSTFSFPQFVNFYKVGYISIVLTNTVIMASQCSYKCFKVYKEYILISVFSKQIHSITIGITNWTSCFVNPAILAALYEKKLLRNHVKSLRFSI